MVAEETGSVIGLSAEWIVGLLLGDLGQTIAVMAVALLGFSMLKGFVAVRQAAQVVFGIAILFGAPAIARSLLWQSRTSDLETSTPAEVYRAPARKLIVPDVLTNRSGRRTGASVPM